MGTFFQNMGESLTGNAWLVLLGVVGDVASTDQGFVCACMCLC